MLGIPIVFLTYKKTQAEIRKLDLEATSLESQQQPIQENDGSGIQVSVADSQYTTVKIFADPRLLAPLLILLDFIFAWIVIALFGYITSLIGFGGTLVRAILAFFLLIPIAIQAIQVRGLLLGTKNDSDLLSSYKGPRVAFTTIYILFALVLVVVSGVLLLTISHEELTNWGVAIAWSMIIIGLVLVLLHSHFKKKFDNYLLKTARKSHVNK